MTDQPTAPDSSDVLVIGAGPAGAAAAAVLARLSADQRRTAFSKPTRTSLRSQTAAAQSNGYEAR